MSKRTEYYEKLKDPRWQKKRLEILDRDKWQCRWCQDGSSTLHVHHLFYLPGREPWNIPNGFLITLCESCHKPEDVSFDNPPGVLTEIIGTLLDEIWKYDATESSCLSSLERSIDSIKNIPAMPEEVK